MSLVVPHRWLRNCVASPLSPGQHFAAAFWQALLGRHIHRGEKVHGHVAENSHVDGVVQQLRDTAGRYQCFCVTASAYLCASVSLHRCGSASSDYVCLSLCALAPLSLCASVFYVSVFLNLGRCVSVASCRVSLRVCVFVGFCMCVCVRASGCPCVAVCLYVCVSMCLRTCTSVSACLCLVLVLFVCMCGCVSGCVNVSCLFVRLFLRVCLFLNLCAPVLPYLRHAVPSSASKRLRMCVCTLVCLCASAVFLHRCVSVSLRP